MASLAGRDGARRKRVARAAQARGARGASFIGIKGSLATRGSARIFVRRRGSSSSAASRSRATSASRGLEQTGKRREGSTGAARPGRAVGVELRNISHISTAKSYELHVRP